MKIVIVTGVRPQYIKAKALYDELTARAIPRDEIVLVDTGQHYSHDLSTMIRNELDLEIALTIKHPPLSSAINIISESISRIEEFITKNITQKALIVVFGDANPALVGAIVALKLEFPLIHIEAGARRDIKEQEHFNSKIVDCIAKLKCCVTARAAQELKKEGNGDNVIITGDMAGNYYKNVSIDKTRSDDNEALKVLVTLHRPMNMKPQILETISSSLMELGIKVIWVTHPRSLKLMENIRTTEYFKKVAPQTFQGIQQLLSWSDILLTDSGGLSREAHYLRKPVLMRRDIGGWPELRKIGVLKNIGWSKIEVAKGIKWASKISNDYPPHTPFYIEGGIKKGIDAILKLKNEYESCEGYLAK